MKKTILYFLMLINISLFAQNNSILTEKIPLNNSYSGLLNNKDFSKLSIYSAQAPDKNTDPLFIHPAGPVNLNSGSLKPVFSNPIEANPIHSGALLTKFQDIDQTDINTTRFAIAGAGLVGLFVGFHFYQMDAWWKTQRGSFHIMDDPSYSLRMDKAGHFYGGLTAAKLTTALSEWTGIDRRSSTWVGAAIGSLWELYIEIEDGFGRDWGFSPSDATADVLGAFYPVVQEYVETARAFNVKFSYMPSDQLGVYDANQNKKIVIDDYKGQTYWLTANIYDLFPADSKETFPDYLRWINIGFGYGLDDYDMPYEAAGVFPVTNKELYISLDYDLMKLFEIDTKFFRSLKESPVVRTIFSFLNYFHLPAPAMRITFPAAYSPGNYPNDPPSRGGKPYIRWFLFYFSK